MTDDGDGVPLAADGFDACVIDLDGTLTIGERATRGAHEMLALASGRFIVLSNNSSHDAAGLSAELASLGLDVPRGCCVLAGETAIRILARERPGGRVLLLASAAIRQLASAVGLVLVDDRPDVVVLARDPAFSYTALERAANAVRAGADLIATNADLLHPGEGGAVVPETGALLAALRACCGDAPCRVIGKPEPALFTQALDRLGTRPERTLMIGDNAATDGLGARRVGMPFFQVKDGDLTGAIAYWRTSKRGQAQFPEIAEKGGVAGRRRKGSGVET